MAAPPHFLRALSSRNYRLYFFGQCVSLLGNWMTSTASLWAAYHLSRSAFYVGLVGFANQIPVLLFAPFAGVLVDRIDALRIVRWTQALGMLQSAALAAWAFSGRGSVQALIALCLLQGFINAMDFPARQALTFRLAGERALLDNVIALNSVTFNLARLAGPALAGFVIAAFGPGVCFALDAVSYLAVLAALMAARLPAWRRPQRHAHPLADLRDGVRYAWTHPAISRVLALVSIVALAGFGHGILAPVFARDVFRGDARVLGFLMAAAGIGSLGAGVFLTTRGEGRGAGRAPLVGAGIAGLGLAGLAAPGGLAAALACFAAAGAGTALVMVAGNTLVQSQVSDDKRGRVMSLFTMSQALFPVGSLLVGTLAAAFGPQRVMLGCGLVCAAAGALFARRVPRSFPANDKGAPVAGSALG